MREKFDQLISDCLQRLVIDPHVRKWRAKERDWVNYFTHRYLLTNCRPEGPLVDPAQIGIEVAVPQPPGYSKPTVPRDLVIWGEAGATCWSDKWEPVRHPLAIVEWKVHRPGRRNQDVAAEREWLHAYSKWQPNVSAYAIEVDGDACHGIRVSGTRFRGTHIDENWLRFELSDVS